MSNLRQKTIALIDLPQLLDSLTILPESLKIITEEGEIVEPSFYTLKEDILSLKKDIPTDSLRIQYRVLADNLRQTASHLDTSKIEIADNGDYIGFDYSPYEEDNKAIEFNGLDYNGSFSRGISFGNTQNLVLNSNFNLQLAGKLSNDVEILAAISDNNIPLQPEGNTQQLQEFDRIFIQLKRKNSSLLAGDYELKRPNSHFMNYYKKLQGASVENLTEFENGSTLKSQASVAISRGKFARNTLVAQEGNQGPYRLEGREGERFIIIQSGTEKVYIDGELLSRGIEQDYTIDYNRADIIFTNKRLITKDSRIIVEFEYANQTYLRSSYAFNTEYKHKKLRLYMNVFSEQDSKNSGGARDLDSLQRVILNNAGDDLENAFAPGVDSLEAFNEFRVSYELKDTTFFINGVPTTENILLYSTDRDSAIYAANFLEVGFGNGNYVPDATTGANGKVYRWVAPDALTGMPQGNYAPGIQLIAPNQQQLFTLGGEYQLTKNSSVQTEVALSNNDPNRFSRIDDADDAGLAVFTRYRQEKKLGNQSNSWRLQTELNYEFVQENFKALNPYRNAEFARDWNVNSSANGTQSTAEHLGSGSLSLVKPGYGLMEYEFSGFLRQDLYTGLKHYARFNFNRKGYNFDIKGSLLQTDATDTKGNFFRPKIDLSKTFSSLDNWRVGVYGERERNELSIALADTLSNKSFYYDLYRVYLESSTDKKFTFRTTYTQRYDYAPVTSRFQQSTIADEFGVTGNWQQGKASTLAWNLTYRQLEILDDELSNLDPQETFLGRLEHNLNLLKGTIRATTNYEIGSGQERKQEFQYLPVQAGEGVYTWINDLNGDSIPQINEIEEAVFQNDANIVRVSLFTDEFIRTNNVQLNQSIRLTPRLIWNQQKGFKKILSRFSSQSTLRILRKTRESDAISAWNPFQLSIADTSLVSVSSSIRNNLFFNRAHPVYDIQVGMFDNRNKVVLTSGFESRRGSEQFLRARWNISQQISTIFNIATGSKENDSEFFNNRDYDIQFYKIEPQLTILLNKSFRSIFTYQYQQSENILPTGGEKATQHDFRLEMTYNQSAKTSVRLETSFVKIDYNGSGNTSLEFAMLEGLRDGDNFLWNVILDRRLSKNIQLSMSYEGRKTGKSNIVHIGRAQLRATF